MAPPTIVGTPAANRYGNLTATVPSGADYLFAGAGYAPGGADPTPSATWNGDALTLIGVEEAGATFSAQAILGLVDPDIGTFTYAIAGTGAANRAVMAMQGVDPSTPYGTPAGNTGTSDSPTVTCDTDTDAIAVAAVRFAGFGTTISAGSGETVRVQYTEDGGGIAILTKARTGATTSFAPTLSGSTGWNIVAVGVNGVGAAGPTIDTQPQADTVLINGDPTRDEAVFTVAATTSGGSLSYQWELETSVGGGVYANVADGSGATWTGATSATLTGTFTVKTLTGRRVRVLVTDSNGTTTSDAVVLTIYTGPVLSKSSGTTNGSGVDTLTITSDYPNADGEFTIVTASAGGVTKQIALHYEP